MGKWSTEKWPNLFHITPLIRDLNPHTLAPWWMWFTTSLFTFLRGVTFPGWPYRVGLEPVGVTIIHRDRNLGMTLLTYPFPSPSSLPIPYLSLIPDTVISVCQMHPLLTTPTVTILGQTTIVHHLENCSRFITSFLASFFETFSWTFFLSKGVI